MARLIAFLFLAASLWGQTPPRITRAIQTGNNPTLSPGAVGFLSGIGFGSAPQLTVNGATAEVYGATDTSVLFRMPPAAPIGQASIVATTPAGSSAPFPIVLAAFAPSAIFCACNPSTYYFRSKGEAIYFPVPGDVVDLGLSGLGSTVPPPLPKLLIDGTEYPVLGTGTRSWTSIAVNSSRYDSGQITFRVPDLQPGRHALIVQAGTASSPAINLDLIYSGIITSQSGLTFNAVQSGPAPLAQNFLVLSGKGTIDFNLTTSTLSGGPQWLSVSPQGGSVQAGQLGLPVKVSIDPTGLAAGAYYGTIQVSANNVLNSPQSVTVVLKVAPTGTLVGPYLDSAGLVFLGTQSGGDPAPQTVTIANPTAGPLSYTSRIQIFGPAGTTNQFSYSPFSATIASGQSAVLTAQATLKGATPGFYSARITLTFSDQSTRAIDLLLVVAPNPAAKTVAPRDATGCTPTKLLPFFSQPGAGFNVPAAWPTPIVVSVVDDCANPISSGTVYVTFSNGDPRLPMYSLRNGSWAATWSGVKPGTSVTLTATASDPASGLTASATITGGLGANPDVPIISRGGIVDLASYGAALAPGSMIATFGSKLAADSGSADSLPLPILLKSATLLLGNKPLPLIYTSDGQVNAMVPYDVAQNTALQMVARNGNAISSPQSVVIVPARPAVFTVDATGTGQGHIYWYDATGNQILAGSKSPAKPGDSLVIYCMGLGVTDPPVVAGVAASLSVLSKTVNPVTANIGGRSAPIAFAGVTPGGTGLYQVNVTLPTGLPDNDATTLVLSAGGQDSATVTLAVRTPK